MLSTASCLAGGRPRHKVVSHNLFDTARDRIQATCKLLAAPLDAILANIEHKDIQAAPRATESAALALAEEHRRHKTATLSAAADKQRYLEATARTAESEDFTLAEGRLSPKAAMLASLSTASPLADK